MANRIADHDLFNERLDADRGSAEERKRTGPVEIGVTQIAEPG